MLQEICQIPRKGHPLNNAHVLKTIKFDRKQFILKTKNFFFFSRQYTVEKVLVFIEDTYYR